MTSYDLCGYSGQPAIIISLWPQQFSGNGHRLLYAFYSDLYLESEWERMFLLPWRMWSFTSMRAISRHHSASWLFGLAICNKRTHKCDSTKEITLIISDVLVPLLLSPSIGFKVMLIFLCGKQKPNKFNFQIEMDIFYRYISIHYFKKHNFWLNDCW